MNARLRGRGRSDRSPRLVLLATAILVAGCGATGASPSPAPTPPAPVAAPTVAPPPATLAGATPAPSPTPAPTSTPPPTPASTAAPTAAPTPAPGALVIVAVPGDTLWGIGKRYGVPLATILAANPQIEDPRLIHVGERIAIPREAVNVLVQGTHDGSPVTVATSRSECYANGWASDPNDRTRDVTVRIIVDGAVRLALVANGYRPDLAPAIGGNGTALFSVDLGRILAPNVAHQIRVQAKDLQTGEWIDLQGTPKWLTCLATPVDAVVNGSFEDGAYVENRPGFMDLEAGAANLTGWTIDWGGIDWTGSYWQAADGRRSLDMDGLVPGAISQAFATTVGAAYVVTFDLSGSPNRDIIERRGPKTLQVQATGTAPQTYVFDPALVGNTFAGMMWQTKTYAFVATSTLTTLTFASLDVGTDVGPALDNVVVVRGSHGPAGTVGGTVGTAPSIGVQSVHVTSDFRHPENPGEVEVFVPTGSLSEHCLVTLHEIRADAAVQNVFCAQRMPTFDGGKTRVKGLWLHVFFDSDPGDNLSLWVNVYQEGAEFWGTPRYCSSANGC
jgi:choice-of-anchor C domain-containing protein